MSQLTTRKAIRQAILKELGGIVDVVASGSTSTIVATNLLNRFYDDNALKNATVYLPDDDAADKQRAISAWDDSTQTITPNTNLSDAPDADDDLEIYLPGDPTHEELNQALNRGLQEIWRPTYTAIPTRKGARRYGQTELPWVRDRHDILNVQERRSPNLVDNEDFEHYGTGDSPALSSWVLSGSGATVTRDENPDFAGPFQATLTASGAAATLTQTISLLDRQLIGETLQFSVQCDAGTTSARLVVSDGTQTSTTAHTGGGAVETLTVADFVVAALATTLTVACQHNTTTGASTWGRVIGYEGDTIPEWLSDYGSEHAQTADIRHEVVTTPDGAAIVLQQPRTRGSQLWVQSLKPYAELAADTDVTDCPLEAVRAVALVDLARRRRRENQERWDEVRAIWTPKARRWLQRNRDRGRSTVQQQVVIGGV